MLVLGIFGLRLTGGVNWSDQEGIFKSDRKISRYINGHLAPLTCRKDTDNYLV